MTVNKRDNIEKEKNIDVKENIAGEVGHKSEITEDLGPATMAAARESSGDHNEVQPTEDEVDSEWDYNEDRENEEDNLATSPSSPTPCKPRMTEEGTAPPDRSSLIGDIDPQENEFEMAEIDEVDETVTEPTPAPPMPVMYRATDSQLINHIILDVSGKVDTENYYSDEEEDDEPIIEALQNSFVDENISTEDKTINMQPPPGSNGSH